jgi:hypothetical protein
MLLSLELKLWQALLAVATGQKSGISAIADFLEMDVPWNDLEKASHFDCNFFLSGIFPLSFQFKISLNIPKRLPKHVSERLQTTHP